MLRLLPIMLLAAACAWSQSPAIPDTPAGHTLQAWFDSFNSGDRARIQAYLAKYEPTKPLDPTMSFREQSGGFDLLGIHKNHRLTILFPVKKKASPTNPLANIAGKEA